MTEAITYNHYHYFTIINSNNSNSIHNNMSWKLERKKIKTNAGTHTHTPKHILACISIFSSFCAPCLCHTSCGLSFKYYFIYINIFTYILHILVYITHTRIGKRKIEKGEKKYDICLIFKLSVKVVNLLFVVCLNDI